jgi:hypothetical protein
MYPKAFVQQGDDIIISIHEDAGLPPTPISQRSARGAIIDSSAANIVFKVAAINFTKALAANPADPRGRMLSLTLAEAQNLGEGARWVILDLSGPVPVDLAKGMIRKYR